MQTEKVFSYALLLIVRKDGIGSLRWHCPDQVYGSQHKVLPLSRAISQLPVYLL